MTSLLIGMGTGLIAAAILVMLVWVFRPRSVAQDVLVDALLISGNLLDGVALAVQGDMWGVPNFAAAAFVAWIMWRKWKRRRRDRAPRSLGDESRLLIAALVAKLRESAQPRPVLRPVPGGAN